MRRKRSGFFSKNWSFYRQGVNGCKAPAENTFILTPGYHRKTMKRNGMPFPTGIPLSVKHRLDFTFVFSGPLLA
jgi:hypothetical protein